MNAQLRQQLEDELVARGYSRRDGGLAAPADSMVIADEMLESHDLGDLMELMVARREKVFRSVDVVGQESAKASYDDVVLMLTAIKSVLRQLVERLEELDKSDQRPR